MVGEYLEKQIFVVAFFFELLKIVFHVRNNSNRAEYLKGKSICIENKFGTCHIDGEKTKISDNICIDILPEAINVCCKL